MDVTTTYDVTMVQLNATAVGGWGSGIVLASVMGFPVGNFSTLVYSQWMCSQGGSLGPSGIAPTFTNLHFVLDPAHGTLTLGNVSEHFCEGSFEPFGGGLRTHVLLSINTQTRTIQLYYNDSPVVVTPSWTGTLGSNWFNFGTGYAGYGWNGSNEAIGNPPGVADIWCASPATFLDLAVTANRRKFINADLTPVYLGANGSTPLGIQPQIYCTVQPGGVATDLLTNHGTGMSFTMAGGNTLELQAGGICTVAVPPPTPASPKLWLLRHPEHWFIGA